VEVAFRDVEILRLFWLSVIEARRPELSPLFFQADLAPPIMRFLSRSEGGCYGEQMKGADYIVCPVHLWVLSGLPLLSSATQLRAMLNARRDNEHASGIPPHVIKDGLVLAVLAFSIAVCIFCMQCVKAVWPTGFRGECNNVIIFHRSKCANNVGRNDASCSPVYRQCSDVVGV
jgi:hypothetical protein